ncbi:MAG: glycine cleavage system protein H, partial [Gammaproteobacteria bacterium]
INDSPYDDGWLIKIKLSNPDELSDLMDADSYEVESAED